MKLSKTEYEELIRKKPSLRPTEVIKSQNTNSLLLKGEDQFGEPVSMEIPLTKKGRIKKPQPIRVKSQNIYKTIVGGPYEFPEPTCLQLTVEQRTPRKELTGQLAEDFKLKGNMSFPEQENPVKSPPEALKSPKLLKFIIPGQPVGKPRMTQADKFIKRPRVTKYWEWAEKARSSVPKGVELAIYREVHFKAYLGFPKSYSERRRKLLTGNPHLLRGDCDNFLKAIQDSLFKEDGCIWKFSGEKRWDDGRGARVEVELR